MATYHFKDGMIEYINKDGYIVDHFGTIVKDHKNRDIFVPKDYRKYYKLWGGAAPGPTPCPSKGAEPAGI